MRLRAFSFASLAAAIGLVAASSPSPAANSAGPVQSSPSAAAELASTPLAPTGQVDRFLIPFFTSQNVFTNGRVTTVVAIFNNSSVTCSVFARFQFASTTSDICSITVSVLPHTSVQLCSRPVSDPIAPCNASCPGGGLTFNTGHIFVGSSKSPGACKLIAVDPRAYYTNSGSDSVLTGSSALTLVPVNGGNKGD